MNENHPVKISSLWTLIGGSAVILAACKQTYPIAQPTPLPVESPRAEHDAGLCLPATQPMVMLTAGGFMSESCIQRARTLVAKMPVSERIGQMMQTDRANARDKSDLATHGIGSILSGGGSGPARNVPLEWAKMVNAFRQQSLNSKSKIPIIYGVDAVHGHNNVHGAVIFPHNIGLGATRDPDLVERIGRVTAKEVLATNIDWTFAPVVGAARDERWGRTYEAYGETYQLGELLAPAMIRGLQGEHLGKGEHSVLACAKHFIGDGNTEGGVDQGDAKLSMAVIREQVLPVYRAAIDAGVGSIMVSFSSIERVKMHCHGPLLNDILKGELGFRGFLVSDWSAIEKIAGSYAEQLTFAINAGIDMVMEPKVYTGFIDTMKQLVPSKISDARIIDAAERIVAAKCELGMLDSSRYRLDRSGQLGAHGRLLAELGSPEHRAVAREAVRKSLVLLKNKNAALPLSTQLKRIHLAGKNADDLGNQSGGWTISWQGTSGEITLGTTIKQAFEQAAPKGTQITYAPDGSGATGADVVVLVIGETPYAEGNGDKSDLQLDARDITAFNAVAATPAPLIVILLSGRPMILGPVLERADAVVAAWLPGTEGQGVTDVLFGAANFTGKLGHSWPRSTAQIPINIGDSDYDPLFPYGFGLAYPEGTLKLEASTNLAKPRTVPMH